MSFEAVDDLDRPALLVDALGVAGPAGDDAGRAPDLTAAGELLRMTGTSHFGMRSELSAHSRAIVSRTSGFEKRSSSVRL